MDFTAYWLTFEIKDETTPKGSYRDRYDALIAALQSLNDGWWAQPTSFILFGSTSARAAIIAKIKGALDLSKDVAVLGAPNYKVMDCIGRTDGFDAVASMVPFAKKV